MSEEASLADDQKAATSEDESSGKPLGDLLDGVTKLGALCFGLIYAIGFIVLNTYYSQFGMADFSLFKARILAAGCLFVLLAALPVILTIRTYGLFGLHAIRADIKTPPIPMGINEISAVLNLYVGSLILLNVTGLLFVQPANPFGTKGNLGIVLLALWCGIIIAGRFWGYKYPRWFLFLDASAMLALMATLEVGDIRSFLLSLWFYSWELLAVWVIKRLNNELFWTSFEWERFVWVPLALVTTFGLFVYGQIYTRYGGGFPSKVMVYVSPDAKVISSSPMTAWLVDEADHGYYLLRSAQADRALYLPREMVRGLEYLVSDPRDASPEKNK